MEGEADFISDLPPPILHHILSYLTFKESVRTSVLSKQWNSVQISFPILEFNSYTDLNITLPRFKKRLHEYLYSVDRSLQNFFRDKLCIERLILCLTRVGRGSAPLVNTWLPLALHNGVSDLRFGSYYPLPETTFTVNPSLQCGSSEFFLLKKLELSTVRVTEKIIQDIIRNCPNLTDLSLLYIHGLENLNISKHDKLLSLTVVYPWKDFKSIFVDGPSLRSFIVEGIEMCFPREIDLTSCCNMRELDLSNSSITNDQFNMHVSRFPLLEVLSIECCRMLSRIRISLQRLKHLKLEDYEIEAIEIDAPILSEFNFGIAEEREDLPVLVLADASPGSMCLSYDLDSEYHVNSFWFLKIREFLSAPFKSTVFEVDLDSVSNKVSFDPDDLRERVIPPPVEIDRLDLTGYTEEHSSYWEALLDGLLWSCHPKKICVTARQRWIAETPIVVEDCVKTLFRMLKKSECQLCSDLSHCKCWRSRFKAATIESIGKFEFDEINVTSVAEDLFSNRKYRKTRSRSVEGNLDFDSAICSVTFRFDWET